MFLSIPPKVCPCFYNVFMCIPPKVFPCFYDKLFTCIPPEVCPCFYDKLFMCIPPKVCPWCYDCEVIVCFSPDLCSALIVITMSVRRPCVPRVP